MSDSTGLVKKFIKKFDAKVVIPWDGKVAQVDIGQHRVGICNTIRSVPQGSEIFLRIKNLSAVLERDVWDVPVLKGAELIESLSSRRVPQGAYRPLGKVNKIVYPTGITPIDLALIVGGFYGRIISRIWGASMGGKSVILYMTMITAWRLFGKRSLIICPEFDFDEDRFSNLPGAKEILEGGGLEVYEPGTGTDAYNKVLDMVVSGDYAIIGVDSLTPLQNEEELLKGMEDAEKVASKAKIQTRFIETVLPILHHESRTAFIGVVQQRRSINTSRSQSRGAFDPVSGSYGPQGEKGAASDALQFYTQQSLKIFQPTKPKYVDGNMVGHQVTGIVDKNKRAAQGRRFEFFINYYTGFDVVALLVTEAVKQDVIRLDKRNHIIAEDVCPGGRSFKNNLECRKVLAEDRELHRVVYGAVMTSAYKKLKHG